MKLIKRLSASLLNLVALSVLFVGSCVGPAVMYYQSPWWFLERVDLGDTESFFCVAFRSKDGEVPQQVKVMWYKFDSERNKYSGIQFHLPNGRLHGVGPGTARASINATAEEQGNQLIQVFVVGHSPWTSLSEYRVVDNKIYPLRHADSVKWLLIGVVICPFLIILLARPIRRGINRIMRVDPE